MARFGPFRWLTIAAVGLLTAVLPFWKKNMLPSGKDENCAELNSFVFLLFVRFAPWGALRFLATEARK